MFKFFSKTEIIAIAIIFLLLVGISTPNFIVSLRRARDQVRKDDIGHIENALDAYKADFGVYPSASPDGKIIACKSPNDTVEVDKNGKIKVKLIPCVWGKDVFADLTPGSTKVYMELLPSDPHANNGVNYMYFTDGLRYQILASLEGADEAEYDKTIVARQVMCGNRVCNMGKSVGCPLDKSIQEYKDELDRLRKLQDVQSLKQNDKTK